MTAIQYNYLNLPTQVTINGQNILYVYDATGVKLKKTVNTTTTDYANGFIYENNQLQFFSQPEGYVEISSPPSGELEGAYVYQYKDHLGNIRLSYSDKNNNGVINVTTDPNTTEIIEENNYYPFGLKHKGYNNVVNGTHHKYMFGGKELSEELGLNTYDFGARNYDAALGRWMNLDPLAEVYYGFTPYNYTTNNPIVFLDPNGMASVYNWGTGRYEDEDGNETSWSNVQAEYGIGGKSSSSSSSAKPDDARVTIKNGKVTISSTIYIYGSGATQNIANLIQSDIMNIWGKNQNGTDWAYTDPSNGKVYIVAFDIQVKLYDSKNPSNKPSLFSGKNNPFSTDNFIEIDKNNARSYVRGGDEGQWRANGRNGLTLGQDDPAPHEFGHLIGLTDRYSGSRANAGWIGNVMAEPAMYGIVQQKNINAVLSHIISRYNSSFTKWTNDNFGTNKQYNTKIDESNPKW